MEKSWTLQTRMVFVCYLLLKEASIHINLLCFDHNFDHPHINVVTFVPSKQSKSHNSSLLKMSGDMYPLLDLSSLFRPNSPVSFLKNCYVIAVPLKYLLKRSYLTALV